MDWKQEACDLFGKFSMREIARMIGKPKSTVSDYLRNYKRVNRKDDPTQDGPVASIGVLLLDLETAPALSYHWGMHKQDIPVALNVKPPHLLSFACKWLGNDTLCVRGLPDYGLYVKDKTDDKELVEELYHIVNAADMIVAHNLKGFDEKVMNSRFVYHNLGPLDPKMRVDTLQIAKNEFRILSNKLDYLARFFGFGHKHEHEGAGLWVKCLEGDEKAWDTMLEYNAMDVLLLEKVFLRLRPWDRSAPNASLFMPNDRPRCVCCGSGSMTETGKYSYTKIGEFVNYVCLNCGKVSRSRKSLKTREDRENILTNAR